MLKIKNSITAFLLLILVGCGDYENFSNLAPIADAGLNQTVYAENSVTLNASSSTDSDGTISSYLWKEGVTTLSTNSTFSKFDFPIGTHSITLTVTDNNGATDTDTLTITINEIPNVAPTANAGSYQIITQGDTVTLNGTSSTDSDGTINSYLWKEGTTTLSTDSSFSKSNFTVGTHTITLTVTDNDGATDTDTIILTVEAIDAGDTISTATLMSDSILGGAIDDGGDKDYFKIVIESAGELRLYATGDTDTYGTLYDSSSVELASDDDDGEGNNFHIVYDVTPGNYYIEVKGFDNNTIGNYTLYKELFLPITHNGTTYKTVTSPYTGKVWLDRNLGASRVCTAYDDSQCYGDYYQWGRDADGHEKSDSTTTSTQATNVNSAGSKFITSSSDYSYDWAKNADSDGSLRAWNWSKTDGSSVCPVGYRVPTIDEIKAETLDEGVDNRDDAYSNFLKLPSAGFHEYTNGYMFSRGVYGEIWSSNSAYLIEFGSDILIDKASHKAYGFSVRCVRD